MTIEFTQAELLSMWVQASKYTGTMLSNPTKLEGLEQELVIKQCLKLILARGTRSNESQRSSIV